MGNCDLVSMMVCIASCSRSSGPFAQTVNHPAMRRSGSPHLRFPRLQAQFLAAGPGQDVCN